MNRLVIYAALPSLLLIAACGNATDADAEAMPEAVDDVTALERTLPEPEETAEAVGAIDAACRANLAQPFVGQTLNLDSRSELLEAVAPQAIIRFLEPEEELGDDTNPNRLNIRTNTDDAITEVFCG